MATDVYVFHFLALTATLKSHDVKVGKICSDVVGVVDFVGWKTAGYPPVS